MRAVDSCLMGFLYFSRMTKDERKIYLLFKKILPKIKIFEEESEFEVVFMRADSPMGGESLAFYLEMQVLSYDFAEKYGGFTKVFFESRVFGKTFKVGDIDKQISDGYEKLIEAFAYEWYKDADSKKTIKRSSGAE